MSGLDFADLPRGTGNKSEHADQAPNSGWYDPRELSKAKIWDFQVDPKMLLVGKSNNKLIGRYDDRHIVTIAGSRAGKGQSAIIPNLLIYTGSVLVLDPKGENADLTAERRGLGRGIKKGGMNQDVFVIDPYNATTKVPAEYRATYNPIAALIPASPEFVDECKVIADALVMAPASQLHNHWNSNARSILAAMIAWVADKEPLENRHLARVPQLLSLPPRSDDGGYAPNDGTFDGLLEAMIADGESAQPCAGGLPARIAARIAGMGEDERGSVMSTTQSHLDFLDSAEIKACFKGGARSVNLAHWKQRPTTIYLCLPVRYIHMQARMMRIFVNGLLAAVEKERKPPAIPALMILDEMHILGSMDALQTAAAFIAGYGVRIWSILQDLNQLQDLYPQRWETFLGNAGLLQFFGINDQRTLEYVSKRLGHITIEKQSYSKVTAEAALKGSDGESTTYEQVPLLSPDEVGLYLSRQSGNQLILYPGIDPIFAQRVYAYSSEFDFLKVTK